MNNKKCCKGKANPKDCDDCLRCGVYFMIKDILKILQKKEKLKNDE